MERINFDDLSGRMLGSCRLERPIGQGGMGTVYLAQQTRPARRVAVKVLNPHLATNSQIYQEFLARFRREADVIARLEHVNILPIYEYGEQEGLAYLVTPYLSGGSLRDVLARNGTLTLLEALPYIQQAALALDYAHAQGVIHRDLKPANILLHADGRLILADFGIARIMAGTSTGSTLTGVGVQLGTPEYMAPEMVRGDAIDSSVDIYELGVVLFQMLSGRVPFLGDTPYAVLYKHVHEPLPHLHTIKVEIPPGVDTVIQKATAKQSEDRYATAQDMAQALNEVSTTSLPYRADNLQDNIPTVISRAQPIMPSHDKILAEQDQRRQNGPAPISGHAPTGNNSTRSTVSNVPALAPISPKIATQKFWLAFFGIPLALLLIVGGLVLGLQLNRGSVTTNQTNTPIQITTAPTTGGISTSTTPPTPPTAPASTQLYATSTPDCDNNVGNWVDYNGAKITCEGSRTIIGNTAQSAQLQGIFLIQIPGHSYPSNYVIQAQLQQEAQSSSDFGLYFRNQPGNQQGVYAFLIHPDGTWNAYVYDNNTGAPKTLTGGTLGNAHASVTLAVSVSGQEFSFYANNKLLSTVTDQTYGSGTAGIAVDQGGTITATNFVLSTAP